MCPPPSLIERLTPRLHRPDPSGSEFTKRRQPAAAATSCKPTRPSNGNLPSTVDLEVIDTPPIIKGATATNQLKDAEMETGLRVRVPGVIVIGETLHIGTADGNYQSRA